MATALCEAAAEKSCGKADWDQFVDQSPQGSIFCRSWWLDAVCPLSYDLITLRKGGAIYAGMAVPYAHKGGRRVVAMPALTQTLGPLLAVPASNKYETNLSAEMESLRRLVDALPAVEDFTASCNYRLANWLPFHWAGYSQTTRYTYLLSNLTDLGAIYDGMSPKTRNIIRKAEKSGIVVEEGFDIEEFLPFLTMTFRRQGMDLPFDPALIRRLDEACASRGCRLMLKARDGQGAIHAVLYHVYDQRSMFYLMQGSDPALRASGAALLAQWHAIQRAAALTSTYDFEGSMMENVECVFRSFGAVQVPYFQIWRERHAVSFRDVLRTARHFLRGKVRWLASRLAAPHTQ